MASGGTDEDWAYIEGYERIKRKAEWYKLKALRYSGEISKEEFKNRKNTIFK